MGAFKVQWTCQPPSLDPYPALVDRCLLVATQREETNEGSSDAVGRTLLLGKPVAQYHLFA